MVWFGFIVRGCCLFLQQNPQHVSTRANVKVQRSQALTAVREVPTRGFQGLDGLRAQDGLRVCSAQECVFSNTTENWLRVWVVRESSADVEAVGRGCGCSCSCCCCATFAVSQYQCSSCGSIAQCRSHDSSNGMTSEPRRCNGKSIPERHNSWGFREGRS